MARENIVLVNVGRRLDLSRQCTPPLGVLYLAAYLREHLPVKVHVIDQRLEDVGVDTLAREIEKSHPFVVGLSAMLMSFFMVPELVSRIREALPHVKVVIGGPCVNALRAEAMEQSLADAAVPGEGERSLLRIAQAWKGDKGMCPAIGMCPMRRIVHVT